MTKTTDTRQLRMTIDSILSKYEIDNLKLSLDLSTAARSFFEETKKGRDAATVRKEIEEALQAGARLATKNEQMEKRIFAAMGLRVTDRWYTDGVIEFLHQRDEEGQTIEAFAEVCKSNPFTMPKFYKFGEKPSLLIVDYGLAFVGSTEKIYQKVTHDPKEEAQYVPNPNPRPRPRTNGV